MEPSAGAGNVLDAGYDTGVAIYGDYARGPYASAAGNLIAGNIIGLGADGETTAGLGNGYDGVWIDSAPNTTVGGTVAAARNIIANNTANDGAGVLIVNFEEIDGSFGTVIQGNYIGTDITGTKALGNYIGIDIEGSSSNLIGTDGQDGAADAFEGNLISGNLTAGIVINATPEFVGGSESLPGAADNVVAGNLIGTNASGTAALGNGTYGVELEGGTSDNSIGVNAVFGAATVDDRNVISGNTLAGVEITGSGTSGNVLAGDYIGTDETGTVALGNASGVVIEGGSSRNTIGGLTATAGNGAGNVISGNTSTGVQVGSQPTDTATSDNLIAGNLIGTDASGELALPNGYVGVFSNGMGTTIGGTAAGALNVISGNTDGNVVVTGTGATNDVLEGNYIGLDLAGTTTVGDPGGELTVETSGNTIGGTTAAARNVISGVSAVDINLDYSGATGNLIIGNYIGSNAAGTAALTLNTVGIFEQNGALGNTIGGTVAGAGNLVAADNGYAMLLTSNNLIAGNLINSNPTGTAVIGETYGGIAVDGSYNTIGGTVAAARNVLPDDGIWIRARALSILSREIAAAWTSPEPSSSVIAAASRSTVPTTRSAAPPPDRPTSSRA